MPPAGPCPPHPRPATPHNPPAQVPGEPQSFIDHIALGVEEAARDTSALLLFSGGQTRKAAGPRSEGLSYWQVAEAAGWFNATDVRGRAYTEVRGAGSAALRRGRRGARPAPCPGGARGLVEPRARR
jgi:hypothetical protein